MLNKPDIAMKMYKMINPIEHTKTEADVLKYKVEPYILEADIYSEGKLAGRGGWTWYTGSASWLYETQIRYIFGINIYHGKMSIKPCVPKEWNEFEVDFKWLDAVYHIKYKQVGEYKLRVENNIKELEVSENKIKLIDSGEFIIKVYF